MTRASAILARVETEKDQLGAFGRRVRRLRRERDYSQDALAALSGIHRNHLGAIERGTKQAGLLAIVRIAAALKVPVGELFANLSPESETPIS